MKKEMTEAQKLADALLAKPVHAFDKTLGGAAGAMEFCEGYKEFLDAGKTEREAVTKSVELLAKAGYKKFDKSKKYKAGDKLYLVNREKAIIAATIGKKTAEHGVRLSIAHIDSPRLDLKPNPLYESDEMAFFKTHYYGGIRKYQWVTIPLSMHGVVVKSNGEKVQIRIGEDAGDPVFCITDLLPHLSQEQNKRPLNEGIKGEELNILIGSFPFDAPDMKERVKLETMRLINSKYGFTEHDFTRAEIEFVPAFKAADVGFDASIVGAYGQDDRVCAYTALMAEIDTKAPQYTSVCVLTDKEETGSDGNTGLASDYLFHFLEDLAEMQKANYRDMLAASTCLSADVNAAFDPTFPDVFERNNASYLNHGVVVTKYTGSRGKGGTSDASAEFMGEITNLFDKEKIVWQVGELGKVDIGGGGTIAMFVANRNIDVVDVGVPVLSMHSPFELTGKLDVYNTYLAFKAFAKG
ncbi:aminopeptidase [Ruminococcaceae bacterium OttesenSCG-928-A16]|nr:aminopeptidase [Ruminococcaceae bacterium OttesenSCG-928-A16]